MRSASSQKNNGWRVVRLFIENVIGNQPKQFSIDPPTTVICFEQGINCVFWMFDLDKCDVLTRQMLAPLSGNTLQIVGDFCMRGSEGDIETLIWSSMAWTILIARASSFFFSLSAKWFGILQLWQNGSPCWAVCRAISGAFLSMVEGSASWAWSFVAVSTFVGYRVCTVKSLLPLLLKVGVTSVGRVLLFQRLRRAWLRYQRFSIGWLGKYVSLHDFRVKTPYELVLYVLTWYVEITARAYKFTVWSGWTKSYQIVLYVFVRALDNWCECH